MHLHVPVKPSQGHSTHGYRASAAAASARTTLNDRFRLTAAGEASATVAAAKTTKALSFMVMLFDDVIMVEPDVRAESAVDLSKRIR